MGSKAEALAADLQTPAPRPVPNGPLFGTAAPLLPEHAVEIPLAPNIQMIAWFIQQEGLRILSDQGGNRDPLQFSAS